MEWYELTHRRNQRSRTYQSDQGRRSWDGTLAALHYESILGSGICDAEIDMTPVRVDNPQFDGWRVAQCGWHHALGKDLANHGDQDGWVGFGGRQGAHWFKFRLQRVGYLHWPSRAWQDIGGAPSYNRAFLSRETSTLTIGPNDDPIDVGSVATWSDIWKTPGGGSLSVSWRSNGDELKEEITINQMGREWIAANRPPSTPLNETYFGFVFRLDWSDIPKVLRDGILQDIDGDFTDDGESIELKDALDRLLGFMPISDVRVPLEGLEAGEWQSLRKRFWSDGNGNHYLLVGVRCDILNGMAAGDLVFDPTVNEQVAADGDDSWGRSDCTRWRDYEAGLYMGAGATYNYSAYTLFSGVNVPQGATIDTATWEVYCIENRTDSPEFKISAEDADNATVPTNCADAVAKTRTSAGTDWDPGNWTDTNWYISPDIKTVIKEVVDRALWSSGNDMQIICDDDGATPTVYRQIAARETGVAEAAKLHITYTAAATTSTSLTTTTTTSTSTSLTTSQSTSLTTTSVSTSLTTSQSTSLTTTSVSTSLTTSQSTSLTTTSVSTSLTTSQSTSLTTTSVSTSLTTSQSTSLTTTSQSTSLTTTQSQSTSLTTTQSQSTSLTTTQSQSTSITTTLLPPKANLVLSDRIGTVLALEDEIETVLVLEDAVATVVVLTDHGC